MPRWAEVGSVVMAVLAIVLAVVLRLAQAGEPLATVRFVFLLVALAWMLTASVRYIIAVGRGKVPLTPAPDTRSIPGRELRRLGRAAVDRSGAPLGLDTLVPVAARRIVAQTPYHVAVFTAFVVLSSANVAQVSNGREEWRWVFVAGSLMFLGCLLLTLRQHRGALRVLRRPGAEPSDAAAQ